MSSYVNLLNFMKKYSTLRKLSKKNRVPSQGDRSLDEIKQKLEKHPPVDILQPIQCVFSVLIIYLTM